MNNFSSAKSDKIFRNQKANNWNLSEFIYFGSWQLKRESRENDLNTCIQYPEISKFDLNFQDMKIEV